MGKTGLVLEGGRMRGAYTAGVLTWLIDHEIEFDYGVGISAGAMNLCSFAMRNKQYLYDVGVIYMPDKRNVGLNPLLKERHYVGYDFMFDRLLKDTIHYELDALRKSPMEIEIGLFNLNTSKVEWVKKQELDDDLRLLKGACTLPLAGSPVPYCGGLYMDGGVTTMVPIKRSLGYGCDKHLVIVTKDEGYVRKPSSKMLLNTSKMAYHNQALIDALKIRSDVYYEEMNLVDDLQKEGKALLLRPSKNLGVKRFSGDAEALKQLFELGKADCETRKAELLSFLGKAE